MKTNSEKPAGGEPKKSNGGDCRFSPRALLLYEMAKRRATRTAEADPNDKKPAGREIEESPAADDL